MFDDILSGEKCTLQVSWAVKLLQPRGAARAPVFKLVKFYTLSKVKSKKKNKTLRDQSSGPLTVIANVVIPVPQL